MLAETVRHIAGYLSTTSPPSSTLLILYAPYTVVKILQNIFIKQRFLNCEIFLGQFQGAIKAITVGL